MIRIMLVDDQRFARLGFQLMLDDASDIVVTAQSADGRSAIETLEQLAVQHRPLPNVILMDVRMPRYGRHRSHSPHHQTLAHHQHSHPYHVRRGRLRLWRSRRPEPAASCSRTSPSTTSSTRFTPSPTVTQYSPHESPDKCLNEAFRIPPAASASKKCAKLSTHSTPRQREICALISEGLINEEIANQLIVEPASVKRAVTRILATLGLRNRTQIAIGWFKAGM